MGYTNIIQEQVNNTIDKLKQFVGNNEDLFANKQQLNLTTRLQSLKMSTGIPDQYKYAWRSLYFTQDNGTYDTSIPISLQFSTVFNGESPQGFQISHPKNIFGVQNIYDKLLIIKGLPDIYKDCYFRIVSYQSTYVNKLYTTSYRCIMYYKKRPSSVYVKTDDVQLIRGQITQDIK